MDWSMKPTTGGASAQESKQARASLAAKHIRHARPHCGQPHQVDHRQPQEESHPHRSLRTAARLLSRVLSGRQTPSPSLGLRALQGMTMNKHR